ncbi:chemotaxis response regulator protein-glutamate methylesterase [Bacillus sp. HMF5848]|uniref:protein-glutamate methylesterase/protein-glutamine glutaminase n=1 Tax=Bacillus sp. HMF5848 TaxID=2495421 RepID=UPI000F76D860|nr:chemotaxis response regulator protein-glutamate methylesterase [Bacillus sp. HMF5848]RSK27046.1 chemotaxis response regulator protein-glutamate methylesterase [Bacillus sp. HMF5848]
MADKKVKVLVVDDSAFMRKMITDFLSNDYRIEAIGTARNGNDAIDKIKQLQPDVVTLDVEMPIMNGLDALKIIMKETPLPVVMLSSTTKEGAENALLAMQLGAIDFIAKPSGPISLDLHKVKEDIIAKVILASTVNLKNVTPQKMEEKTAQTLPSLTSPMKRIRSRQGTSQSKKLIVIGTSTGGPRALQQVLTKIPANIDAPILIVQHMPPGFTKSLATRLDSLSNITIKEAENGEILQKGTAYIAPGGFHLKVKRVGSSLAVLTDQSDIRNGHRPSVDVMFESVSDLNDYEKIAVIMTGMGADGSEGLVKMKQGGKVKAIAEAAETCVVFGMPKSAIATQLVDDVVPLDNISLAILKYVEA